MSGELDIFGQVPGMYKLYTQLCSIYPADTTSDATCINTLTNGLDRLAQSFPWLTGHVVNEGAGDGCTGVFRIIPLHNIQLVVKDLRSDPSAPTMDGLRRAKYPFTMLDENVIAPCPTLNLPGNPPNITSESALVFCVQANFIDGGLMLTTVTQHNVMDMTGHDFVLKLLSKACKNEPFTSEDLALGNMDRSGAIPLLDTSYTPGPELAGHIVKPSLNETSAPAKSTWAYIEFSETQLAALKVLASSSLPPSTSFVSTDDAVSAFVWQCIARARASRLGANSNSMLARAVDPRTLLDMPKEYPGLVQCMAHSTDTIQKLSDEPLGVIAAQLRSQLDPKENDLAFKTRALATYMSRSEDKSRASVTASVDVSSDFMLSSWSRTQSYEQDFGLELGKPEAVRRPHFTPFEGLGYLMPRSPAGELPVAICLRDEDWARLRTDPEFLRFATYIG
ncbi:unnamed protein product [Penicillium olsonii]|uniref:Trichothecene 3-O-acetyltransferase-like N-terminal domain-containing protein n=1 Tax=Penicillium olsonii TaxID=99116 RepID=A0A9W4HPK2_PENOL|nr:unnamed protein product [Penicillium olsonii]CAG8082855.1 unnamed protein product [Penicillium olsonii]CAG8251842.1 unnamed protein product [Penicillium olsonii]